MKAEGRESVRNRTKYCIYASVLFLEATVMGLHFRSIQTAGASTAVQAAVAPAQRVPSDKELVDALVACRYKPLAWVGMSVISILYRLQLRNQQMHRRG